MCMYLLLELQNTLKKNQSEVNGETDKSTTNSWRFQYATLSS